MNLAELLSQVMRHSDCPDWLREAILGATIENFDNNVVNDSPEFFYQMIFGAAGGNKNVNITINQK